ncbi:hypothetical protein HI914_06624 [Erysiphe necator]|nr:hypothetical protein HI914_06624 [Erysiphe necator]
MGKMASPQAYQMRERSPQCTHMKMTRLHSPSSRCYICQRDGSTALLYQCTHDHEIELQELADRGEIQIEELFESLWDSFVSPLHAVTKNSTARPVAKTEETLIKDRNLTRKKVFFCNKNPTIQKINYDESESDDRSNIAVFQEQCVPLSEDKQCNAKYCRNCFPYLEQRIYLELDSIVNGKIPLTALTAYPEYQRHVALASTVKNLGLRLNPKPKILVVSQGNNKLEDCHNTPPYMQSRDVNFNSTFQESHRPNSTCLIPSIHTGTKPRLYSAPNIRRVHRTSNRYGISTTTPPPLYVYNKTCILNNQSIKSPPILKRILSSMPAA